jgi:lipid II isoglutaminyl synthase (glutamine-hydrolysing)
VSRITVGHLYPEHLNIYADRGNIAALERRCSWRGIAFDVIAVGLGDALPPADLYYLGGGQDRDQLLIAADIARHARPLAEAVAGGAGVLAVCGGYQLLGHYYRGHQGDEMRGLGLVDLVTEAGSTRMIGNIVLECPIDAGPRRRLVGFENHAGRTTLGEGVAPLGQVVVGHGNNGRDGGEGVHAGSVIGTYVHGPLLPKNPWLSDWLIARALARHGQTAPLQPLDDTLELEAGRVAAEIAAR